jgi:AbrB family looped-hinge helix DNA binding protein
MNDNNLTTLTERGQISVPAALRRDLKLEPGQRLLWEKVSDQELRLVALKSPGGSPGPRAMGGHANQYSGFHTRTTEQWLSELREGEEEE